MVDLKTHIANLDVLGAKYADVGSLVDEVIVPPALELLEAIKDRVINTGRDSEGRQMRKYSTKPMYASRSQFIAGGFSPEGKHGNKKEHTSMYLPRGYKQLREVQGLRTDITNMYYSGQMMFDFVLSRESAGGVVWGFNTQRSADVYAGQSKGNSRLQGRGEFLQATIEEKAIYTDRTIDLISQVTIKTLKGYAITTTFI